MTLLSANDAAIIANAVYTVMPATSNAQAAQFAGRDATLAGQPHASGASLSENVTPIGGMVGSSGAFVKETTGFGMVLERGSAANRELIVSIRGTQSTSDWLSNLNIGFEPGPSGSIVHAGFNRIYNTIKDEMHRVIRAANPQKVHFCGHSLGGALATLAAVDVAGQGTMSTSLYTFGAPRVGSVGLLGTMRRSLPAGSVKRVYALSDPVPMIPLLPFLHYGTGSTGINANYSGITASAHSMDQTYIPQMPQSGWPPQVAIPNKSDPDYWLDQAERSTSWGSAFGYWCLGKALEAILPLVNVIGAGLSATITVLDRLVSAITSAVQIGAQIGETVLRWVKAAMRFVGHTVDAAMTAGDITASFLRYVLDLLLEPVKIAARAALNRFT